MGTNHAHVDAATFTVVLLLTAYGVSRLFGWTIPPLLFGLPAVLVLFIGTYLLLYLVMFIAWRR